MKNLLIKHWPTLVCASVVFIVAILIRLPSCYESFWVDELHTAWAIWGDFGQVAERAAVGNQTPLYFQLMWVWKLLVGDSEVGLRMSSVLAIAVASMLLVIGVKQTAGRLSAGVLAGSILAVESNSLFFGTEFRPYAFVMLCTVIATWAAVNLLSVGAKISHANLRLILVAATGVATLLHPTAIVTLGILTGAVVLVALVTRQTNFKLQISDFVSLILIAAIGFSLAKSSLGHSWEIRDQWRAFGKAASLHRLWAIWPWWTLAITPGAIALLSLRNRSAVDVSSAMLPLLVAVVATSVFFAASYFDWVPLWHRRYFVAVIPMFAWSIGACFALPVKMTVHRIAEGAVFVAGAFFIATLLWKQGTIQQWQQGRIQLVFRGEDWRGAADWVRSKRGGSDRVIIDAGLIEADSRAFTSSLGVRELLIDQNDNRYLAFPLSGPYFLNGAAHGDLRPKHLVFYFGMGDLIRPTQGWVIARASDAYVQHWARQKQVESVESKRFGRIFVLRYVERGRL